VFEDNPTFTNSPLWALSRSLAADDHLLTSSAQRAAESVNKNHSKNTYLTLEDVVAQACALPLRFPYPERRPLLYGLPISVKDCFDLAGKRTTGGSRYYAQANVPASKDSWVVERLRSQGAIIVGKTHLHELAYGITGENLWYGDCLQPNHPELLTGGSSSGAAASIQEASAVAAIGTDTGGSVRVPAALCGLSGYRSSLGLGSWSGAMHLAESFDTIGWLFRDLRDGPVLAAALFDLSFPPQTAQKYRIGTVSASFVEDSEPIVKAHLSQWQQLLVEKGHDVQDFDTSFFKEAMSIFAPIQASEAARLHRGHYDEFERSIGERLKWGASLSESEVTSRRTQHAAFRSTMNDTMKQFDFLLWPCSPLSKLAAGTDHQEARGKILPYTLPVSLAGLPAMTLPGGIQLIGSHGDDSRLLALSSTLPLFTDQIDKISEE
jgi:Asp-tRNA(Asn)/Glu-tRNA(Gln) amidotransferase A subunit family amidase